MKEFLEKARLKSSYIYFISTYGTTPGASDVMANRALKEGKIDAFYSVKMADTWTPTFDLSTEEKIEAFTKHTEEEIDSVIEKVREREKNEKMSPRVPAFLVDLIAQPLYNSRTRLTSHFRVEETCIGCGLCEKKCPVGAIKLEDKKPTWIKKMRDVFGVPPSMPEVFYSVWKEHEKTRPIHQPQCKGVKNQLILREGKL